MLKLRIITAVCMALAFLAMLFSLSPVAFSVAILPIVIMAGWEWSNLSRLTSLSQKLLFLGFLICCLWGSAIWINIADSFDFQKSKVLLIIAVGLWSVILLWIQGYPSSALLWYSKPVLVILGATLLVATWVSIVSVLFHSSGQWYLLLGIVIVAMVDIGGFFVGKVFGKRKLAPVVSPGKTWEGFAGGMIFQLFIILAIILILPNKVPNHHFLLIFPVALFAVVGDLFESMIKRETGVKDSGSILPGHGGILDRIDGVMAAMPLFALLIHFIEVN